ncbi:MAG: HtrA protease/chaperone protein [Devosia sp.]|nr:HtrA protease/chaperone protein [Devosia sp.]
MTLRLLQAIGLALLLGLSEIASGMAAPAGPESVSQLAGVLSPAVVNISTTRHMPGGTGVPFPSGPDGSPLGEMFDDANPNAGKGPEAMAESRSLGSGFIISADGLIVTNNHVIEGADEVLVFLTDGRRFPAEVLGTDFKTDIAVLRIEVEGQLPFVQLGDSDTAEVGDWVMAIGNPFGLGGSVTLGIVSARNRQLNSGPYDSFIQTDASINQGNSGGPLFDMDGMVVGINTAIIARGGMGLGIGFAVPINIAKNVVKQLTEYGETRRGWLGVGIQPVTEEIALSLGLPGAKGVMVVDVTMKGPSDGVLEEGDVILEFDTQLVGTMQDLPRIVAETEVGRAVPVKVLRGGVNYVFDITLGRLEAGELMAQAPQDTEPVPGQSAVEPLEELPDLDDVMGFAVAPLDDAARATHGIGSGVSGVIVDSVKPGSDAAEKGFVAGLIIAEVNQQKVVTVADLTTLVNGAREAGRPAVLFKVTDPTGASRFIAIKF